MKEEDSHGGITIGAMGIINRNAKINKMQSDVSKKGTKSKYWEWYQDKILFSKDNISSRIEKYEKLPKWLKWIMKNPNKI